KRTKRSHDVAGFRPAFRPCGQEICCKAQVGTGRCRSDTCCAACCLFAQIHKILVVEQSSPTRAPTITPSKLMPREPIGIVTPKDRALSRAAQLFIDFTREGRETIGEEKIIDAMSASGTSATSLGEPVMSASGGEAGVPQTWAEVRV